MKSYSGLVGPQNPLITLLKKKRETKVTPIYTSEDSPIERCDSFRFQPVIETDKKTIYVKFKRSQEPVADFKPMSIHHYEPGKSSIVGSENIHEPKEYNPPICKPGDLCNYSDHSDSMKFSIKKKINPQMINSDLSEKNNVQLTKGEVKTGINYANENRGMNMYKEIMRGGDIPSEGLTSYVDPRRAKTLPGTSSRDLQQSLSTIEETLNQAVSDLQLSSTLLNNDNSYDSSCYSKPSNARLEKEIEILSRRKEVERMMELEKWRGRQREERRNLERRHNDFLLPTEKAPVKLDRYSNNVEFQLKSRSHGIAMYNFTAMSARELSMVKGERLTMIKKVDRNWWEVEKGGVIGIVPVTYVKPVKEDLRTLPPSYSSSLSSVGHSRRQYPQGRMLYDFETNYPSELPVKKGERLSLIKNIDADWVEVRSKNGQGTVPSLYVQPITDEYEYDVMTSSRTVTPSVFDSNERLETASPIGSVYSVLSHAPTIPSAPRSPVGSQHSTNLSSDWPRLDASLANLQQNILNSHTDELSGRFTPQHHQQINLQQQQILKPSFQQRQQKQELVERYNSILRKQRHHKMTSPMITQQVHQDNATPSKLNIVNVISGKENHNYSNAKVKDNTISNNINNNINNNIGYNSTYNKNMNTNNAYNNSSSNNKNNMTRSNTSEFSNHTQTIFASPERFLNQHNPIKNNENKGYFESKGSVLSSSQYNSNTSNDLHNINHHTATKQYINSTNNQWNDNRFNTMQYHKTTNNPNHRYTSQLDNRDYINNNKHSNFNTNSSTNLYNSNSSIAGSEVITLKPIKLQAALPPDYSKIHSAHQNFNNGHTMDRNATRSSMIITKKGRENRYGSNTVNNSRVDLNNSFNSNYSCNFKSFNTEKIRFTDNEILNNHRSSTVTLTPNKSHKTFISRLGLGKNQSTMQDSPSRTHTMTNDSSNRYKNNYRVLREYQARKEDELMLTSGDVIKVVEKCKDGWWVGVSMETGHMGIFPGNHVKPV